LEKIKNNIMLYAFALNTDGMRNLNFAHDNPHEAYIDFIAEQPPIRGLDPKKQIQTFVNANPILYEIGRVIGETSTVYVQKVNPVNDTDYKLTSAALERFRL
jgi:hypothetical protein